MKHLTSKIAMIRPNNFGYNVQTAGSNSFQNHPHSDTSNAIIAQNALEEFDEVVDMLLSYDIDVLVLPDSKKDILPDSIFPNNWFSTFEGVLVTYSMYAENRRLERSEELINTLKIKRNYQKHISFEEYERQVPPLFLEGTGSLVLDRINKIAYAAVSVRTDASLVEKWCIEFGYQPVLFKAFGPQGELIYHTNVMMCIGDHFALVCLDCIDPLDRTKVIQSINASGKILIEITKEQTFSFFAGNMIQLISNANDKILVMSQKAYDHLTDMQLTLLKQCNKDILACHIPTIEKFGGGSVRCMIAELF